MKPCTVGRHVHLVDCMSAGEVLPESEFVAACRESIGARLLYSAIRDAARRVSSEVLSVGTNCYRVLDMDAWLDVLRALDAERRLRVSGIKWLPYPGRVVFFTPKRA